MYNTFLLINSFPWPIIAVSIIVIIYICIYLSDEISFRILIKRCIENNLDDKQLVDELKKYIKHHPFSTKNTDLVVKMIPSLVSTNQNIIKWIKRINAVDIHPQLAQSLLFSYFVLSQKGYSKEIYLLRSKTKNCFRQNYEFNITKEYIFDSKIQNVGEILQLKGKYSKGICLYYLADSEYDKGHIVEANKYIDKATELIPEKIMLEIAHRKKREYEETN